ncbi:MAG: DNA translocase FtsK 4TM domain-containing protein [Pirellulales bacterium]
MLESRSLKLDLLALGLFALAIFLGIALFTYDPADSLDGLIYPVPGKSHNACGRSGALAADLLFQALGVGAYYLLVSISVLDAWLLARRAISDRFLRGFGWLMSLVGLSTLSSLLVSGWSPGPVIGPGGYLGAAGRAFLEMHFANAGAILLTLSVLIGGLLLCTEYTLPRLLGLLLTAPGKTWKQIRLHTARSERDAKAKKGPRTDLDGADADESEPTIRIRGKTSGGSRAAVTDDAADDDVEDAAAEGAEGDEEEEVATPAAAIAAPPAPPADSGPRLRRPKKDDRAEVMTQLDAASLTDDAEDYELPGVDLLMPGEEICYDEHEKEVRRQAKILEKTFLDFGFRVKVVEIETGPVIAQFEVELEAGLRLSKITSLADDLAIALRVPSVRIVAPIPGKNTVGIEVPNSERHLVRLREVIEEANGKAQKMRIPIYLGKDVSGKPMVVDLTTLPHLLIAGRTGTGKSVCLNSIIVSMLMTRRPDEVRMLMIDPKMVELSCYKRLPHLMHPVVTDMRKAEAILAWAVEKMEERYALLARAGVRHISVYNQLGEEELMDRLEPEDDEQRKAIPTSLPYIVIVADEMADLMMTAAKEVEQHIIRLAQKSRAVGIHLVLATQKPTVDVITGLIKSNLPARIAFQVASRTDSRVVLDEMGADKLLGNGDMLFLWPGTSTLLRGQGTYVSDDEINSIVDICGKTEQQFVKELVQLKAPERPGEEGAKSNNRDELYESAVEVLVREGRGSVSLLQRALGIGYGRAARLIDYMAEDGYVGEYNGSQAREVLLSMEQWEAIQAAKQGGGGSSAPAPAPKSSAEPPRRSHRVLTVAPRSKPRFDDDEFAEDDADDEADDELAAEAGELEEAPFDDEADDAAHELDDEESDAEDYDEDEGEDDSDEDGPEAKQRPGGDRSSGGQHGKPHHGRKRESA